MAENILQSDSKYGLNHGKMHMVKSRRLLICRRIDFLNLKTSQETTSFHYFAVLKLVCTLLHVSPCTLYFYNRMQ